MHNSAFMKNEKLLKNTMNSQVYNKALRQNLGCPICPPNKGCNRKSKNYNCFISWKNFRGTQWKE